MVRRDRVEAFGGSGGDGSGSRGSVAISPLLPYASGPPGLAATERGVPSVLLAPSAVKGGHFRHRGRLGWVREKAICGELG